MPNPTGENNPQPQLGGLGGNSPKYGAIKRLHELQRQAPLAGGPFAPLNAPRRAQQKSVRGTRERQAQPEMPRQLPDVTLTYEVRIAQLWREILTEPGGDTPLNRYYYEQSARAAGLA